MTAIAQEASDRKNVSSTHDFYAYNAYRRRIGIHRRRRARVHRPPSAAQVGCRPFRSSRYSPGGGDVVDSHTSSTSWFLYLGIYRRRPRPWHSRLSWKAWLAPGAQCGSGTHCSLPESLEAFLDSHPSLVYRVACVATQAAKCDESSATVHNLDPGSWPRTAHPVLAQVRVSRAQYATLRLPVL
jgi:hypothetical protein